jgi:hypothetical protein
MLYIILGILLGILILNWMPRREGATTYQDYDETSCLALANQNQKNIEALQNDVTNLLALQDKLQAAQNSTDANSKQLNTLVDKVYNTPE